ncbi:ATP-dependent RNA helicase DEAH11, chloroplastic [Colletotrichum chlorophyti]|uniref:RBR-type E3 ubiquitin transferase n=1 Tax=Colletotrichum chlorophyti TaxID=708187 RepID=A0A1Q8RF29_9PEZI|nr:ATP-dependent RNA helicase DEAH11, chloroplastic [Colletotrichum chlorophyti]
MTSDRCFRPGYYVLGRTQDEKWAYQLRKRNWTQGPGTSTTIEEFQRLDEDIANLVLLHGLLNLDDPFLVTPAEVADAAALALQMAGPDEQLAIALRRSTSGIRRAPTLGRRTPNGRRTPAHIGWEERNRILTDSAAPSEASSEVGPECVVCTGGQQPKLRLQCGCWMCARCLRSCIRAGLREGGWPPRCCEPLGDNAVEWTRRPDLARLFLQIKEENETPGNARIYCARPACASFIPPAGRHVIGDEMRCRACGESTCRLCKNAFHPGRPCRVEDEDEMLMDTMDQNGMAFCPQCRRIIELRGGCNHITLLACLRYRGWCFLCGGDWADGCRRGCQQYGQVGRVPMRRRETIYRQRRQPLVDNVMFEPQPVHGQGVPAAQQQILALPIGEQPAMVQPVLQGQRLRIRKKRDG